MKLLCVSCALLVGLGLWSADVEAQSLDQEVRAHYYAALEKNPWHAFLWDAALPGAGSVYDGFIGNAVFTALVSVAGASLWTYGAIADNDRLYWVGAGTFAAGRAYGMISAPIGSVLLNAAYRRHLHIALRF